MDRNQVVLVTGASSGIGKATALRLLQEGYTVYGAARHVERMRELETHGGVAIKMDITKEKDVLSAVRQIREETDGVDILINNAGFGLYGAVEDIPLEEARYQFEVNLFGLARLTQEVLPLMRRQRAGKIVNISSMGGKIYTPMGAWYHATKHALEGWSDSLRLELKPFGIDVIIVEPGIITTDFPDAMIDPMMEKSGDGPYAEMAEDTAAATKRSYAKGPNSDASVVARTIVRAIQARRPRIRYVTGQPAALLIFIRTYLGARLFDWLITSQTKA